MGKLHLFELRSGHILLDGVTIRGIRECEFSIKENDSLAELSLKMDVRSAGSGIRTRISRKKFKDILKMSPNVPIKSSNMITSKKQRWFSIRSFS